MPRARRIAVLLLLGAVTTVAVAWASCLCVTATSSPRLLLATDSYSGWIEISKAFAHDAISCARTDFVSGPGGFDVHDVNAIELPGGADWSQFNLDLGGQEMLRAGWPLRCLEAESQNGGKFDYSFAAQDNKEFWSWRFRAPHRASWRPFSLDGVLPLRPVALPFAANAALYAAVWWLLFFALSSARRALRRRRGQCPACAYSLAGLAPNSPCPECGHSRT